MSAIDNPAPEGSHTPFSPSFDPNAPTPHAQTPLALRPGVGLEAAARSSSAGHPDPLWSQRLSVSFSAIADQIAAASRALAAVDVPPSPAPRSASAAVGETGEVAALAARLDAIERAQAAMGAQLQAVQERLAQVQVSRPPLHGEKERGDIIEVSTVRDGDSGQGDFKTASEIAIEELQKQVEGIVETIRLDQARLYARLHNAAVTVNKHQIKAPVTASGKPPPNFPNTKGEFEHLTKERYEALLKAYNLPITGDTNAKREALREFIGLTPPV